jgi:parallel beta-helix repeat protein
VHEAPRDLGLRECGCERVAETGQSVRGGLRATSSAWRAGRELTLMAGCRQHAGGDAVREEVTVEAGPADRGALVVAGVDRLTVDGIALSGGTDVGVGVSDSGQAVLSEVSSAGSGGTGIEITGSPGAALAQLDVRGGRRHGISIANSNGVTIDGATVTDSAQIGAYVYRSSQATLRRVRVSRSGLSGISVNESAGVMVEEADSARNGESGVALFAAHGSLVAHTSAAENGAGGILVVSSPDVVVFNALAHDHGAEGVKFWESRGGAALFVTSVRDRGGIAMLSGSAGGLVRNSVVAFGTGFALTGDAEVDADHVLLFGNGGVRLGVSAGGHDIEEDPLPGPDLLLLPGSPAIDAGDSDAARWLFGARSARDDGAPDTGRADLGWHGRGR